MMTGCVSKDNLLTYIAVKYTIMPSVKETYYTVIFYSCEINHVNMKYIQGVKITWLSYKMVAMCTKLDCDLLLYLVHLAV